jgi:integrase
VLPRVGELELRRLTPAVIAGFADELRRDGVGDPTVRKVLSLLQGVLGRGVVLGKLPANPVAAIVSRRNAASRAVRPLAPAAVERLRREMPTERDATLVSILAYAGLRPGEALALTWEQIGERTILAERSLALGELKETKTRSTRSIRLLAPLRSDLNALRMLHGRPGGSDLVFPPHRRAAVAGHRLAQLAQPRLPAGSKTSSARPDPTLRPPPLVRLTADRRATNDH